jgi:hypothetical protein
MAKTATRLYAPFGTRMSLGNYVRVLRTFVDSFTAAVQPISKTNAAEAKSNEEPEVSTETETEGSSELRDLMQGLRVSVSSRLFEQERPLIFFFITGVPTQTQQIRPQRRQNSPPNPPYPNPLPPPHPPLLALHPLHHLPPRPSPLPTNVPHRKLASKKSQTSWKTKRYMGRNHSD